MTTHYVRHQFGDNGNTPYVGVTLPTIPGLTITTARDETQPRQPAIRRKRRNPTGVALEAAAAARKLEWLRYALHDLAEGEA